MKKSRKKVELICLECNQKIVGGKHLSAHVQKEHDFESYNEYKIKHGLIKTNSDLLKEGAVSCKLCSTVAHDLTSHIIRIHKISCQEYKEKYGDFRSTKFLNDISERVKGENNPAYQHGGKYSPFSDKFIHADKIDKAELCQKVSKSNRENGNNDTTIKYWLNRGYSEQESKDKISERQSTFSLAKCIEKHGEELGRQVWLNRQEKWQESLQNKSIEEIQQINMKKSTGRINQLFNSDPVVKNIPAILYYIKFYNDEIEFWKIGITSKTIKERFGTQENVKMHHDLNYEVLFIDDSMSFYDCFKKEQKVLNNNKDKRIIVNYKGFTTTEAFECDIYA